MFTGKTTTTGKWCMLVMLIITGALITTACGGGGEKSGASSQTAQVDDKTPRISFAIDEKSNATYKQHIADLWEKTKPILREDAEKSITDEQLLQMGKGIKQAWVNVQVHGSLHHKAKLDSFEEDTKDHKLGNMTANVIGLIDNLYGWPSYTKEKREEEREKLRKGRLEYKIKEFDGILKSVNVN